VSAVRRVLFFDRCVLVGLMNGVHMAEVSDDATRYACSELR
jgi:hypothetical protein